MAFVVVVTLHRSVHTGLVQLGPGLMVIKQRWLILAVATIATEEALSE